MVNTKHSDQLKAVKKIPIDMVAGSEHASNLYGIMKVIHYSNAKSVIVKFLNTGYRYETYSSMIRKGNVKDKMVPSVFGVAYFGVGRHPSSVNNNPAKNYTCWFRMIRRCYSKKYQDKFPTYKGCSVHLDWHNFQNFASWYENNYPNDGLSYDLDKDIKIDGNRVYGPETCLFVTEQDNIEKARSDNFEIKSPSGEVIKGFNIRKFARDNNLCRSHLSSVIRGERKSHKGWVKA